MRRLAHSLGYRFRLHRNDLPGTPNIVFPGRRMAVFVHGCFWHVHAGCKHTTVPKSRRDYWEAKITANRERDLRADAALRGAGWDVLVVGECETRRPAELSLALQAFLGPPEGAVEAPSRSVIFREGERANGYLQPSDGPFVGGTRSPPRMSVCERGFAQKYRPA